MATQWQAGLATAVLIGTDNTNLVYWHRRGRLVVEGRVVKGSERYYDTPSNWTVT